MIFKNINSFEEYVREHGTTDTMTIGKYDLIMDYYDEFGREVTYRLVGGEDSVLVIETSNRYAKSKFTDAICNWIISPELD